MIRVVLVRDDEYKPILSTFFATLGPEGQQREYYLSKEMEKLIEDALTKLMSGERETMRALCGALSVEFHKEFPRGILDCVYSYRVDRVIVFERVSCSRSRYGRWRKGSKLWCWVVRM